MKKMVALFWLFVLFLIIGLPKYNIVFAGQWIDLSHDFSSETIYWPNADTFKLSKIFEGETDKGYYYSAFQFCAPEHGGTHVDAPVHFAKGKKTVDQIPIDQLLGDAIVVDISEKALKNRDYLIVKDDFIVWETLYGKIPDRTILLLKTGYSNYWPDRKKYMGTDKQGKNAIAELHFPGLHPSAALWLIENRKINAIGIDTPSIDYGQSKLFKCHQIFSKLEIPIFENVANLDQLPPKGAFVIALPIKIKGGSGAPIRIIALLSENTK